MSSSPLPRVTICYFLKWSGSLSYVKMYFNYSLRKANISRKKKKEERPTSLKGFGPWSAQEKSSEIGQRKDGIVYNRASYLNSFVEISKV